MSLKIRAKLKNRYFEKKKHTLLKNRNDSIFCACGKIEMSSRFHFVSFENFSEVELVFSFGNSEVRLRYFNLQ